MNQARIVRADAGAAGVTLRLWVDDEAGKHLAVAETTIPAEHLAEYARECVRAQNRSVQHLLQFDD